MSRSNAPSAWLHTRLRKWAIGASVFALAAWLFQFSTHLHIEPDDGSSSSVVHLCGYCAAMQAGAGPVSVNVSLSPTPVALIEPATDVSFSSSRTPSPYRSRAPPLA